MPLVRKMKEITKAETTGGAGAVFLGCEFTRVGRYDEDFTTTLIHGIDTLRFLGGDLAEFSVRSVLREGKRPFRSYLVHGRFVSGALMEMQGLPVSGRTVESYTVAARDRTVRACIMGADAREVTVYGGGKLAERYSEADLGIADAPECVRGGFYEQARRFLDAVRSPEASRMGPGESAGTTFEESLQSVELADFLRTCGDGGEWHPLKGEIRSPKSE
jgi:hypothetical protein